ncbi:protein-glutamate methylesterase/protein-glutamine glutaminase [Hirschia baltica]|uniref:Protein-glutamate methylesterase/protein-glutamine glutaminase n=1 Tax=Hirschia baltica (strain ATCC 49814 / DSM 5838 / IFAM 1418) TaxID=582402 RepID=C6XM15_HIRBI|nr:chemotaxis response regulator protein-glutamate methylesterase [Hirschia baltica]ACT59847.1 response regulator receiver modulated CheB methylesterase [Hirschia baltica ATCC 49814]
MSKIKVVVVDDSALMRRIIPSLLEKTGEIEVVATAPDPIIARQKIKLTNPDVITLDVEMPKMDGISFLEKIMSLRPMPVVMISSLTTKSADVTLRALELGAVDFVTKPALDLAANMETMSQELIEKVKTAATSNIQRRRTAPVQVTNKTFTSFETTENLVAIGASTGGVETLGRLLPKLPRNSPAILITQHMPPNFTRQFAERLNKTCAVTVREAENNQRVRPGEVWISPGSQHLTLKRSGADYICKLSDAPAVNGHRPSVDVLFDSVAEHCGSKAIGVILTGMGKDGAKGLLNMKQAGAKTFGQDEATSIVYGMPRAAFEIGAVDQQLREDAIIEEVLDAAAAKSNAIRI